MSSNMIADITLTGGVWKEIYAASGLTSGSALTIQNKSGHPIVLFQSSVVPTATEVSTADGVVFYGGYFASITNTLSSPIPLYALCDHTVKISVQYA